MKLARPTALFLCLGLASAAAAATPPTFSTLRQEHPQIDTAIAAMPNSDLNGTFNRLSAILHRSQVDSATSSAGLPANYEKNMEATLEDLRADLTNLAGLDSDANALNILQVVRLLAFQRNIELYGPFGCNSPCTPLPPEHLCPPCFDDPTFYSTLQSLVGDVEPVYERIRSDYSVTAAPATLTPGTFVDAIHVLSLHIPGVESIDG